MVKQNNTEMPCIIKQGCFLVIVTVVSFSFFVLTLKINMVKLSYILEKKCLFVL